MIRTAVIIPTGEEVKAGIVRDIDSPEVMSVLLKKYPDCRIIRLAPIPDVENTIVKTVEDLSIAGEELVVLIGGSGGGHRHSATLSEDYTHSALERCLDEKNSYQIYGKNGHMWCNLVCGRKGKTIVINLPGPFREAAAAIRAFTESFEERPQDYRYINENMAKAVIAQYPIC